MKTFNRIAAQGEALFLRVDGIPENVEPIEAENGKFIVAHSETGHHHVMNADTVELVRSKDAPDGMDVLYAIVKEPTMLEHLRPYDTHEPILFNEGTYRINLQREYTPEGYRRVAD